MASGPKLREGPRRLGGPNRSTLPALGLMDQPWLVSQLAGQSMLLDAPELETPGHRVHEPRPHGIAAEGCGAREERHAESRVEIDPVSMSLLIVEEAGQQKALRCGGFHDLGIEMLTSIHDEQIEDRHQARRT